MISDLIIYLPFALLLGLLIYLIFWVLGQYAVPEPVNKEIRVGVVVIVSLMLILLLLNHGGSPIGGLNLPRWPG